MDALHTTSGNFFLIFLIWAALMDAVYAIVPGPFFSVVYFFFILGYVDAMVPTPGKILKRHYMATVYM
jgi:hypothetical protein